MSGMSEDHGWSGYAASYVLGALDAGEKADFEAHMQSCAACRSDVQDATGTAALLAFDAPPAAPPAALRERILARARAQPTATAVAPVPPAARPREAPARPSRGWVPYALAASVLLALASMVLYAQQRSQTLELNRQLVAAQDNATTLSVAVTRLDSLVAARDSILDVVLGTEVRTGALVSQGQPPSARLYWNRARGVVVIAAYDLPPASPGRVYQLWGIPAGQAPVSLGTFDTAADGTVALALPVDSDLEFAIGAITEEPAGGSPQPTSTPFLVGPIGAP